MPKKIYYVGLKTREAGGETAFMNETQIRWFPGDDHIVPDNVASRMLAHPDVFSDKSPEERAELERQAKERALQEQAAARPAGGGGTLEQLLAALPPGTTITLANGTKIEVPAGGLKQDPDDENAQFRPKASTLAGAHASGVAQRLSAATGIPGELDGEAAMQLQETQVNTSADASGISLAPGATVAPAPSPAPAPTSAPAPTPAPTAAPAPAPAAGKAKR